MALDGPIRDGDDTSSQQIGYLAGSRALDSLDKLITSTESYFHPSNAGHWTLLVCQLIIAISSTYSCSGSSPISSIVLRPSFASGGWRNNNPNVRRQW